MLLLKKKKGVEWGSKVFFFFCTTGDHRILSLFCGGGARVCVVGIGEIAGADGEKKAICVQL